MDNSTDRDDLKDALAPDDRDGSDDDLDLSELLEKYMLEPQDKSGSEDDSDEDRSGAALEEFFSGDDEETADDVDSASYGEFASEVYSDEDASRAAAEDADVLDDFVSDVSDHEGASSSRKAAKALDGFEDLADSPSEGEVYGEDEDALQDYAPQPSAAKDITEGFEYVPAADDEVDFDDAVSDYSVPSDFRAHTEYGPSPEQDAPESEDAPETQDAPEKEDVEADAESEEKEPSDADGSDAVQTDAVYEDAGQTDAVNEEESPDDGLFDGGSSEGLYVDGSEFADELADLSAFAEGEEILPPEFSEEENAEKKDEKLPSEDEPLTEEGSANDQEEAGDFKDYEAKEEKEKIDIDESVDSTDINLMLAFGLDDELERTMGPENAQRLTEELDEEQRKRDEHARKTVDNEYMNRSQTAGIAKDYKKRYASVRIRLAVAAVLSVVLFFYENLRIFKLEFTGAFDATVYPTVYIMGSLQIFLLIAACAYDQIFAGFVRLFKGVPDHRSVTAIAASLAVVYSAVLPGVTTIAHKPLVLNFAVALIVVFTLISELYNVRREIFAFNVVSSKKPKHVITKGEITDGDYDSAEGDVLKFETASFVDGFFTRTKEPVTASKTYAVAALAIAFVSAAISGILTNFASSGVNMVGNVIENSFSGFFIALPVSMMIAASYPFYRAARSAYDIDGAIIGECSLEEYSDAACVTFDDIGVFPSYGVRVQNIKIYNNHRIDRVLYYAASVFSVARGPLTDVFDMATVEIGHSDDVRIRAAGSGYLSATVDDKNITFGSAAELITRGFDIPENVTDEDDFDEEDISVMYMFREDRLMAKLFIKYTIDGDFETIIASLCEEGISVSIKTYDPNIDNDLIASGLSKQGEYSYSVTRYDGADDGSAVRDNADSGIVSRSNAKTLLQLISDCTKVLASRRAGTIIGIISSVVSAILLAIIIITGNASALLPGRISAIIATYQLFWMIPAYISAKIHVR